LIPASLLSVLPVPQTYASLTFPLPLRPAGGVPVVMRRRLSAPLLSENHLVVFKPGTNLKYVAVTINSPPPQADVLALTLLHLFLTYYPPVGFGFLRAATRFAFSHAAFATKSLWGNRYSTSACITPFLRVHFHLTFFLRARCSQGPLEWNFSPWGFPGFSLWPGAIPSLIVASPPKCPRINGPRPSRHSNGQLFAPFRFF